MAGVSQRRRWGDGHSVEERRDEILRSLGVCLRKNRLSTLRMQDIADQLSMTKGNLYYYFKSKQEILYYGHVRSMQRSLSALEAVEAEGGSSTAQLRRLLEAHIVGMLDDPGTAVLMTGLDELAPTQRRRYIGLRDQFEAGVRRIITAGVSSGEFRAVDISVAGFAMLGSVNFMPQWFRPNGRLASAELARSIADLFVHALLA